MKFKPTHLPRLALAKTPLGEDLFLALQSRNKVLAEQTSFILPEELSAATLSPFDIAVIEFTEENGEMYPALRNLRQSLSPLSGEQLPNIILFGPAIIAESERIRRAIQHVFQKKISVFALLEKGSYPVADRLIGMIAEQRHKELLHALSKRVQTRAAQEEAAEAQLQAEFLAARRQ